MTVLVTCGYQASWCDFAQSRLGHMGIANPAVAERTGLNASDLIDKMTAANKNQLQKSDGQIVPGKAWQIAAADMFVANAEADIWGWADPRNLKFLEFWRDFDPACRFILVYGSPAQCLADILENGDDSADSTEELLARWTIYHEEMLKFYHLNTENCLLVHVDHFNQTAKDVALKLQDHFDVPAHRINIRENLESSAVLRLVAENLLSERGEDLLLLTELESSADLPNHAIDAAGKVVSERAHEEFAEVQTTARQVQEVTLELERLRQQLGDVRKDAAVKDKDLQRQLEEARGELARASKTEESELLMLQLQQVQEELELYFTKYNDLKAQTERPKTAQIGTGKSAEPSERGQSGTSNVSIDVRSYIDGAGWHSAEQNGRWAGRNLTSSVEIPPLKAGRYRLEINVTDAMAVDIFKGLSLLFDGRPLSHSTKLLANVGGRLAPLRRIKADLQKVEKPYPVKLVAHIAETAVDFSAFSHTLEIKCPRVISPSDRGGTDGRQLSICVDQINLEKVA